MSGISNCIVLLCSVSSLSSVSSCFSVVSTYHCCINKIKKKKKKKMITCYCFKLGVSSKLCPGLTCRLTHLFRKYFYKYFIKSVRINKQSYKVIASLCCVYM